MPLQDWQIQPYEAAAMAMCQTLGENPHQPVLHESGAQLPQWVVYAMDMHKLRLMQSAMQTFGPWTPV